MPGYSGIRPPGCIDIPGTPFHFFPHRAQDAQKAPGNAASSGLESDRFAAPSAPEALVLSDSCSQTTDSFLSPPSFLELYTFVKQKAPPRARSAGVGLDRLRQSGRY